jgi:hypothetical protein
MTQQPDVLMLTSQISKYVKARFESLSRSDAEPVAYPDDWDIRRLTDCQHAAKIIWQASRNIGYFIKYTNPSFVNQPGVV